MAGNGGEFSDIAALGGKVRELADGSEEREAYLQQLAADIRAGRYRVDSEELARKLLEGAAGDLDLPEPPNQK